MCNPDPPARPLPAFTVHHLSLKVQPPPVDGVANKACRQFLAKLFNISKSSVVLKSGANSREKAFLIAGISLDYALARLPR